MREALEYLSMKTTSQPLESVLLNQSALLLALSRAKLSAEAMRHYLDLIIAWIEAGADPKQVAEDQTAEGERLPSCIEHLTKAATDDLELWNDEGISAVPITSNCYPQLLKSIFNPPPILFVRGNHESFASRNHAIAIVGSRRSDGFGDNLAREFAKSLAASNALIVSGLALGIDGMSHRGALDSGVKSATVAILGNGLKTVYPKSHERLASEIIDNGGALISQFEPKEIPYPSNFLSRNRIIAGLSNAILVVQAADRSGSLVTARYGLEEGRDVLAVPGSIADQRFKGSNNLIRQGAHVVTCIEDVFDVLGVKKSKSESAKSIEASSPLEKDILQFLAKSQSVRLPELVRNFGGNEARLAVHSALLNLELDGLIFKHPGDEISVNLGPIQRSSLQLEFNR